MNERRREHSWSGSEDERREQGECRPPSQPMDSTARFSVRAGISCQIKLVDDTEWTDYRTQKLNEFERYESYRDDHYVFRHLGYQLRVHRSFVKQRKT